MMYSNHHPPKLYKRRILMLHEQDKRSTKLNHQKKLAKDKKIEEKRENGQLKHKMPDAKRKSHQRRTYAINQSQHKRYYPSHLIYDNSFYGYYFKCNQFGHKEKRCILNFMHRNFVNQGHLRLC